MDRNWILALGGAVLIALILVVVFAAGGAGGGAAGAARAFFASIPSGGAQAAYGKTAPAFQSSTSPEAWAATVAQHNLAQYVSSTWDEGSKGGDMVTLNGVLTLKGPVSQPATVRMVKGATGWSVYSLDLPSGGVAGATTTAAASTVPPPGVGGVDTSGAPVAPSGAPDGSTYGPNGQPGAPPAADSTAPAGALPAPQPGAVPPGYPPAPGQGTPVMLVPGRIAHDCGPHLLRLPGVQTLDVHCVNGMASTPGTRGQCQALVNGRPTNVSVTVSSYDPASDDAELDCRLY